MEIILPKVANRNAFRCAVSACRSVDVGSWTAGSRWAVAMTSTPLPPRAVSRCISGARSRPCTRRRSFPLCRRRSFRWSSRTSCRGHSKGQPPSDNQSIKVIMSIVLQLISWFSTDQLYIIPSALKNRMESQSLCNYTIFQNNRRYTTRVGIAHRMILLTPSYEQSQGHLVPSTTLKFIGPIAKSDIEPQPSNINYSAIPDQHSSSRSDNRSRRYVQYRADHCLDRTWRTRSDLCLYIRRVPSLSA